MNTLDPRAFVTVPRKPTGQQLERTAHNLSDEFGAEFVLANKAFALAVYEEMLAGAPAALSQPLYAAHRPPQETKVSDWVKVAKLAGEHGVRYRTNAALEAFLSALYASPQPALAVALDTVAVAHEIAKRIATSGKTGRVHQIVYDAATEGALEALALVASPQPALAVALEEGPDLGGSTREPSLREILISYYKPYFFENEAVNLADRYLASLVASPPPSGEVEAPPCWWINHGSLGQITQRDDEASLAISEGKHVVRYTVASPPPSGAVGGPEELHIDSLRLLAFKTNSDEDRAAAIVRLTAANKALTADNERLRVVVSKVCEALPNGAFCSPQCSVEFMEEVPGEVASVCSGLSAELAEARKERDALLTDLTSIDGQDSKWAALVRMTADRDRYKAGLQTLATTFYKEDQHQDYAKHVLVSKEPGHAE